MDEDNSFEEAFLPFATESPGDTPRALGTVKSGSRERSTANKALSVLRASTKVQQQRRGSSSHSRFVEEEELEEDSTLSPDEASRRRATTSSAAPTRVAGRQRGAAAVASVEAQRRNATRGEWSPAEEAVLAYKHMELGNKWTTISHFLPARSDNEELFPFHLPENIWHSTLRSKNSDRRSFLRTYARAVRDCAHDAEARRQAYDMAQRMCGPSQPIEVALATVQQQYQQQMLLQGSQQDELLEGGRSPEHQQGEGDLDLVSIPTEAKDASPSLVLQQPLDNLLESRRSGASSRTTSAAQDSQQHSGSGTRGHGSPAQSPLPKKTMRATSARAPSPAPSLLEATGPLAAAGGSQPFQSLFPLSGDGRACSRSQSHQQAHVLVADDGSLPPSSRASDFDSSCIARFSGLQLADQLQRQQQYQQHQQQHQQPSHLGPAAELLSGGGGRHSTSLSSGPHGRTQPPSHAVLRLAYGSVSTAGAGAHRGSVSTPDVVSLMAGGPNSRAGPPGAAGCPADIDDLMALGLDLTPEELRLLAQGDTGVPAAGLASEAAQGDGGVAAAEKALGLTRTLQQQQQHQFVVSAQAGSGGTASSLLRTHSQRQQQSGFSSLELPSSPLMPGNASGVGGGRPIGPQSGPMAAASLEQRQPDPLEVLLSELEQTQLNQMQFQPQAHPVLGLGAGAGYPGVASSLGPASPDRMGFVAPQGMRAGQHGPVSCSTAFDAVSAGPQHLRQPGPSGLSSVAASSGSLAFANGGGMGMGNGVPQLFSSAGAASLSGSRPWLPGLLRSNATNGNNRTFSSPAPFCCDVSQLRQQPGLLPMGSGSAGIGGFAPQQPLGSDGGAAAGQVRASSTVAQHMTSLAEPTTVDVVTMGLDSGNLLGCMEYEGEPVEPERYLMLQVPLHSSQPQPQIDLFPPRGGFGQQQGPPPCWPASMPPANSGRIGPMLQL